MEYYVYLLIDPRDETVFYVGKGSGNRMRHHINAVKRGQYPNGTNAKLYSKIKKILNEGYEDVEYKKEFECLDEQTVYDREKEEIEKYGLGNLCNLEGGGGKAYEVSKETREKLSQATKNYYKNHPNEKRNRDPLKEDECRKKISESLKKHYKEHPEAIENLRKKATGRRHSEETKEKISKNSRRPENIKISSENLKKARATPQTKEQRERATETKRNNGKPWHSEATLEKLRKPRSEEFRESCRGKNNHFFGKKHTKETTDKASEKLKLVYYVLDPLGNLYTIIGTKGMRDFFYGDDGINKNVKSWKDKVNLQEIKRVGNYKGWVIEKKISLYEHNLLTKGQYDTF
jgi:hypothetical protein